MAAHTASPFHCLDRARLPVVLLGGINLVRTLGLAGLQAIVATSDPGEPALHSRDCTIGLELPPLDQHDARVDALVALGNELAGLYGCRVPLMYGSDDALELINAHRERLGRYFLFLLSDPAVGEALIAKDRFQALARARGLPVPAELAWDADGPGSLRAARGEVIVKPRVKVDWHHSALCHRLFDGDGKARVFASGREAAEHPVVALHHEQLVFQEYIPGDDQALWSFHGLADDKGEVLQSFVGRKRRTYPAGNGESAFIEMQHDDALEALGREVARRCPLRGVFKMDFKRDPRDGRWYLLEINARFSLWHYVGAVNGVNLMRATYDYLVVGERPAPAKYGTAIRWLSLELDYRAFRQLHASGKLGAAAWLRSIVFSRNVYNLFSWRDPAPWLHLYAQRLGRKWRLAPTWVATALRQWRSTAS
jgi:predicted ATP-grasp superfamily ATP-dependent carboligase